MALLQITAPGPRGFTAGLETDYQHYVLHAAPILHYMRGWYHERVLTYCRRQGWTCEVIDLTAPAVRPCP